MKNRKELIENTKLMLESTDKEIINLAFTFILAFTTNFILRTL